MRLTEFRVQWFKNFRREVVLDELSAVNIIHGMNNVGKSNLLQAIDLFFSLLEPRGNEDIPLPLLRPFGVSARDLNLGELEFERMFNLESPFEIRMSAELTLDADELARRGTAVAYDCSRLGLTLGLARRGPGFHVHIERFRFGDGVDALQPDLDEAERKERMKAAVVVTGNHLASSGGGRASFALFDTSRRRWRDGEQAKSAAGQVVPDSLALGLWDAKESADRESSDRWRAFKRLVEGVVCDGPGQEVIVVYNRKHHSAQLMVETETMRIPFSLLGTGYQQVAAMVAQLLLCGADIVAIEEPEIHLRHLLQKRVRDIFQEITAGRSGPRQIIVTSHSPAFETGEHFYAMQTSPDGPVIERRPINEARTATGYDLASVESAGSAPVSYVTSEGLVEVPRAVREKLGLEQGGGVWFIDRRRSGRYEFMNDAQFNTAAGIADPDDTD